MNENFFSLVYEAVRTIPAGRVASYGYIAAACGFPRMARHVGYALHRNPDPTTIPCHRVVMADGSLTPAFAFGGKEAQRALLQSEGITFKNGKVQMELFKKA